MRGVYLVAAECAARGLIVSPTSRSAIGADLLVTGENCAKAFSVQVKTNAKAAGFWLVGEKATKISSSSHVYVLVNLRAGDRGHDFYVVPSKYVARHVKIERRPNSRWFSVFRSDVSRYKDKWNLLGAHSI